MTDIDQPGSDALPSLLAYPVHRAAAPMPIVPAAATRAWMDATDQRFANRCLPLLIANQAGWFLLNTHTFRAVWSGGTGQGALEVLYYTGARPYPALSLFGHGILTFHIPYLFRTPPGYNLLARGPANWPKDGAAPLEGIVESDWAVATFTMNWQLTRPEHVVTFEEGEPICMIVPQRRGDLETFQPRIEPLSSSPQTEQAFKEWSRSRQGFLSTLRMAPRLLDEKWQRHYFQGTSPGGVGSGEHQSRLHLRRFEA
jgi:hypothetical protein